MWNFFKKKPKEESGEKPAEQAAEEIVDQQAEVEGEVEPELEPEVEFEPEVELELEPEVEMEIEEDLVSEPEVIAPEPEAIAEPVQAENGGDKPGFFRRLVDQLTKTKESFVAKLKQTIRLHGKVDEELLEELEEIMIQSDIGPETAIRLIDNVRKNPEARGDGNGERLIELLKTGMLDILGAEEQPLHFEGPRPYVVLVIGVNGTGKTTTIGKLAQRLRRQGRSVLLVAGDTFRAAAVEQLEIWAHATNSKIVRQETGADPGSVCFDALKQAVAEQTEIVLIDTAGRLHTKTNLMEELKKIERVIRKVIPDAPHETLLVLDATTGQNAMSQAKIFSEAVPVTGLVMTKLDGTAKGGILIALADKFKIPIRMIGIGESAEDYRDFSASDFVDALFEE